MRCIGQRVQTLNYRMINSQDLMYSMGNIIILYCILEFTYRVDLKHSYHTRKKERMEGGREERKEGGKEGRKERKRGREKSYVR